MTQALYPAFKASLMRGEVDMESDFIRVLLIDPTEYTYDPAHIFLDEVPSAAVIDICTLTSKAVSADGVFDSDDPLFEGVGVGTNIDAIIMYLHTGTDATSPLIHYKDEGLTGVPMTGDGGDIELIVDEDGWFGL